VRTPHTDKDNIIITRMHTWLGSVQILRKVGIVVFFAFLACLLCVCVFVFLIQATPTSRSEAFVDRGSQSATRLPRAHENERKALAPAYSAILISAKMKTS